MIPLALLGVGAAIALMGIGWAAFLAYLEMDRDLFVPDWGYTACKLTFYAGVATMGAGMVIGVLP